MAPPTKKGAAIAEEEKQLLQLHFWEGASIGTSVPSMQPATAGIFPMAKNCFGICCCNSLSSLMKRLFSNSLQFFEAEFLLLFLKTETFPGILYPLS